MESFQERNAGPLAQRDLSDLAGEIKRLGRALGFQEIGITDTDLRAHESRLAVWLADGHHGTMQYMARHDVLRTRPADLVPGTLRIISARMNYFPAEAAQATQVLAQRDLGYISRYALGRDYHKVLRARLQRLADRVAQHIGPFGYRVFVDSAPVLEKAVAEKAGLGWIGKHTNLLQREAGSWFFLGELFTDLPLPCDRPAAAHCGSCRACIDACPTGAIVAPYRLDARRCISYLTIELRGAIPVELRPLIGNRIYGCDDCQLVCPWNRFATATSELDFRPRHGLDAPALTELFGWDRQEFDCRTEGMAVRRTGYEGWLRNVAVALGNAPPRMSVMHALRARSDDPSALVREHVRWALARQAESSKEQGANHCDPSRS